MELSSKECYLFSEDYRTGSNPFSDTKSVKSKERIFLFLKAFSSCSIKKTTKHEAPSFLSIEFQFNQQNSVATN